jgi:hypothetical protein
MRASLVKGTEGLCRQREWYGRGQRQHEAHLRKWPGKSAKEGRDEAEEPVHLCFLYRCGNKALMRGAEPRLLNPVNCSMTAMRTMMRHCVPIQSALNMSSGLPTLLTFSSPLL